MKRISLIIISLLLAGNIFALTYDGGSGTGGLDQGDVISGSNANAVVYANGSKAITTNTSLTYNGTTLGSGALSISGASTLTGTVTASSNVFVTGYTGAATTSPTTVLDVNGVLSVRDSNTKGRNNGLVTEASGLIIDFGMNDGSSNRFGGSYTSSDQGGFIRWDTRSGQSLFQIFGRVAGAASDATSVVSMNSAGVVTISSNIVVSGNATFSSLSVVDGFFVTAQTVTSGSTSTLTWTEVTDRLSEFVTSSFTVTLAGYYEISVQAGASQTAGSGCLLIKNNGTTISGAESCSTGATALATVLNPTLTRIFNLAAGDIIRVDGSATSANVSFQKATLSIKRIP